MKLFGSLKELVALVFRKDSKEVTLGVGTQGGTATTREFNLPAVTSNTNFTHELIAKDLQQIADSDVSPSAAIARSKLAAGTVSHVVINDGSGNFSSEAQLAKSRGGAGADMTNVTFPSTGTLVTRDATETLLNKTTISSTGAATGALTLPSGTTAQQPTPTNGMIRYNTDSNTFEGYSSGVWSGIGGGGTTDRITQAGHGFSLGDVLYLNGSTYTKAIATSAAASEVVGVVSRVIGINEFEITITGEITGLSGLVAGEVYFLSDTVAGSLTATEPTTIGNISKPVFIASTTTSGYVLNYRGVVVGGANARTQITLANNSATNIQPVSLYDAGEMAGWVNLQNSTPANSKRFYVQIQFSKNGAGTDYNVAYQTTGDTPPAGFNVDYNSAGSYIRVTLPNISGLTTAVINYALNAPAVGTNFPLTVDGANVTAASAIAQGVVTTGAQTFAGKKTFDGGAAIKGDTSGSAIATGYIGQKVESQGNAGVTQTGAVNGAVIFNTAGAPFLPLSAGTWLIHGYTGIVNTVTADDAILSLYDNTAAAPFGGGAVGTTTTADYRPFSTSGVLSFSGADRTIYLYANRNGASTLRIGSAGGSTQIKSGYLIAIRIA